MKNKLNHRDTERKIDSRLRGSDNEYTLLYLCISVSICGEKTIMLTNMVLPSHHFMEYHNIHATLRP